MIIVGAVVLVGDLLVWTFMRQPEIPFVSPLFLITLPVAFAGWAAVIGFSACGLLALGEMSDLENKE